MRFYDEPLIPNVSVSDHVATDTGLVDVRGQPIKRPPNTVGFHCPKGVKR